MSRQYFVSGKLLSLIAVYNILIGIAAVLAIAKLVSSGPEAELRSVDLIFFGSLTMAGAVLGGVIRCFQGIHDFGLIRNEFLPRHIGSYIIGPLAAAFLGCAAFVLVHGGIVVLGGTSVAQASQTTELPHVALGILAAFAWEHLLAKFRDGAQSALNGAKRPNADGRANSPELDQ